MNFILKAMLRKQMKNIPAEEQDKIILAFEKNPHFFEDLAKQIQDKVRSGKDQQTAAMEVIMANKQKLSEIVK